MMAGWQQSAPAQVGMQAPVQSFYPSSSKGQQQYPALAQQPPSMGYPTLSAKPNPTVLPGISPDGTTAPGARGAHDNMVVEF